MPSKQKKRNKGTGLAPPQKPSRPALRLALVIGVVLVVAGLALVGVVMARDRSAARDGTGFPAYVYNSPMTLEGYQAAVKVGDNLKVIPCYCGCVYQKHQSLRDCFFKPDGSYNDHASNCHLCVEEAADLGKWYEQGLTQKEMRALIEQKFQSHGPGTLTPPIA